MTFWSSLQANNGVSKVLSNDEIKSMFHAFHNDWSNIYDDLNAKVLRGPFAYEISICDEFVRLQLGTEAPAMTTLDSDNGVIRSQFFPNNQQLKDDYRDFCMLIHEMGEACYFLD